jgi:hypothetical protein
VHHAHEVSEVPTAGRIEKEIFMLLCDYRSANRKMNGKTASIEVKQSSEQHREKSLHLSFVPHRFPSEGKCTDIPAELFA